MSRRLRKLQRRNIVKKKDLINSSTDDSSSEHSAKEHSKTKEVHHKKHDENKNIFYRIYDKQYKKLMILPVLMLIVSIAMLGIQYTSTGSIMEFGVSITGGISLTVVDVNNFNPDVLKSDLLAEYPDADITSRKMISDESIDVSIEASGVTSDELLDFLQSEFGTIEEYSIEETGSTLGESFFKQSLFALVFAFILMGFVVFVSFKTFIPSLAVIISAASDMIITMAIVDILEIRVSTAGLAAFLMLIGYSVDTDILLTSKLLKGKGTLMHRIMDAMGTGMMMTMTTICVLSVCIVFSKSPVLSQIMTILLVGLIVDIINTWIQNVGILRLYLERKE